MTVTECILVVIFAFTALWIFTYLVVTIWYNLERKRYAKSLSDIEDILEEFITKEQMEEVIACRPKSIDAFFTFPRVGITQDASKYVNYLMDIVNTRVNVNKDAS